MKLKLLLNSNKYLMNELVQIKKHKRLKNGKSNFECFVLSKNSVEDYFTKLNANLKNIPDTRYQILIEDEAMTPNHWIMMDCYIKDHQLHTFTLDAISMKRTQLPLLKTLSECVPDGKHYAYHNDEMNPDTIHSKGLFCLTFAREHASIISKINPDELYGKVLPRVCVPYTQTQFVASFLDEKVRSNFIISLIIRLTFIDLTNVISKPVNWLFKNTSLRKLVNIENDNVKLFHQGNLTSNDTLLAPLFRSAQYSPSEFEKLPEGFLKTQVSEKKKSDLARWYEIRLLKFRDKRINASINKKQKTYQKQIEDNQKTFINDRSGFGFITFPVLTRIKSRLENETIVKLKAMTKEFIDNVLLNKDLKYTKSFSFLKWQSTHAGKSYEIYSKLRALSNEKSTVKNPKLYVLAFCDIIYDYAGYLDKNKSDRTLKAVNKFFQGIEESYLNNNDSTIKVSL